MVTVNYVREHMRFIEYASDENVTASERLLWYALMHIMNQRAQGCEWPDDFIRVSNDRLLSLCPMTLDTLAKARNRLKQRGLIDYQNGEKNKRHPAYKVQYFYPNGGAAVFCPNFSGNIGDNHGYNYGDYCGDNMGDYHGGNKGNNRINLNIDQTIPCSEEEEEYRNMQSARARAREKIETAWRASFGTAPTPEAVNRIERITTLAAMEDDAAVMAIQTAAAASPRNPAEYVAAVLYDWQQNGVKTAKDAGEYAFINDAVRGKIAGITLESAFRMREKFRSERAGNE